MLTMEICCRVLHHPVYFCDGATTLIQGYDVISAASLVSDTETKQTWSKHTVQCGHAVQFTHSSAVASSTTEPSTATNQSTVRRSSTAASTTANSTATDSSTVYNASTTTSTTADLSTTTPSAAGWLTAALSAATASTTRDTSTSPMETDRLPSYKSSRPSHYRLAASTSSPTSADLGDSTRTTATVNPAPNSMDSTYLDPLAPMFIPRFVSTPAFTTTHPFTSVLLPVGPTSICC